MKNGLATLVLLGCALTPAGGTPISDRRDALDDSRVERTSKDNQHAAAHPARHDRDLRGQHEQIAERKAQPDGAWRIDRREKGAHVSLETRKTERDRRDEDRTASDYRLDERDRVASSTHREPHVRAARDNHWGHFPHRGDDRA